MKHWLLMLLAVTGLLASEACSGVLCECGGEPLEYEVVRSEAIVVGRLKSVGIDVFPLRWDTLVWSVEVERYLKGSGPGALKVETPKGCAFADAGAEGQRFVLLLQVEDERYTSSQCDGSKSLETTTGQEHLTEVEAITGPGRPPEWMDR